MKTASSSNAPPVVVMKQRIVHTFSFLPYGEVFLPVVVSKSVNFSFWRFAREMWGRSVMCLYGFFMILQFCCIINCSVSEIVFFQRNFFSPPLKINQAEFMSSIDSRKKTRKTSKSIISTQVHRFRHFKGDRENDGMTS